MLLYRLLLVSSFVLTILGAKIGRGENEDEGETEVGQETEDNNFNLGDLKSPPVLGFSHGFFSSLSVILVSELGDKTFFIAAIMAMKYSRLTIFAGALLALAVMTVLSVFMGAITTIKPRYITYYVSTGLFALFGLKMLKEGFDMKSDEGMEELEEVQQELKQKDEERERSAGDVESGPVRASDKIRKCISPVFIQAFTMTFLAEWGDRSQLTTIILGARENALGVSLGGVLGHAFCTGLAVMGGRLIATKISVKTVTIIGGVVFLVFALSALFLNDV
jgi:putative Ca2+/H+ antiporter (TMEM165/GDT1 family)